MTPISVCGAYSTHCPSASLPHCHLSARNKEWGGYDGLNHVSDYYCYCYSHTARRGFLGEQVGEFSGRNECQGAAHLYGTQIPDKRGHSLPVQGQDGSRPPGISRPTGLYCYVVNYLLLRCCMCCVVACVCVVFQNINHRCTCTKKQLLSCRSVNYYVSR